MTKDELQEAFDDANRAYSELDDSQVPGVMPYWNLITSLADLAGVTVPLFAGSEFRKIEAAQLIG